MNVLSGWQQDGSDHAEITSSCKLFQIFNAAAKNLMVKFQKAQMYS